MCGIFGYLGSKNTSAQIVFQGIKTLEYRGYDSWGIAVVDRRKKTLKIKKRVGMIGNSHVDDLPASTIALGHTRWATHGGVTEKNAHPHLDCTGTLAVIHNGIVENYARLKKDLLEKGHTFKSETDTEVIVHLIEDNYRKLSTATNGLLVQAGQNTILEAVRSTFTKLEGMNAIIVIHSSTEAFIAAKNGSPLSIGKGTAENFLASDAHALIPYTQNVYFMDDSDMVFVDKKHIRVYETVSGKEKQVTFNRLNWEADIADKGAFSHFMLKEITEQPKVIENIVHTANSEIDTITNLIRQSYGTYLVGCGTAAYACLAGTYIFSKIAKRHVNFAPASEFRYLIDFLTNKSLVISLSQSGETIDVIDAVKGAKEKHAKIVAVVNVLGSTLYRISDKSLLLGAGVEKAVVSTKAFTAKIANLILLAYNLIDRKKEAIRMLQNCVTAAKNILSPKYQKNIKDLAQRLKNKEHIYVIGRGASYPIALEIALKIKESSYIHAEGFAAGELKHGVIALIEKETPCIVIAPNDETYAATLAGAQEMRARGGKIIGISTNRSEVFDEYFPVADCGIGSIILAGVIGQLLGYYLAVIKGYDPDKPRNLAKSVTVK